VAPFPRPGAWGLDPEAAAARALAGLDALHRRGLAGARTACYLVEPVQGLGGCHPAGRAFLAGLRERADRHGALLVMDEVQTGIGRSGAPVAASLYGVAPDLICLGKALGAGFPIAAVGGGGRLRRALAACAHGSTFSGSPLSCAAALAGLDVLRDEELCRRARLLGARASWRLRAFASGIATVAEVRGPGLMIGVELADPDTRRPRPDLAAAVCARARARGVLLMLSGRHANVIRILPPLVIDEDDLDDGLAVVEEALGLVAGG
jgi:4-aminobutyrate aminotransferase